MKRSRCSKWSHEETMVLAELKKESFLNKREAGKLVWKEISQTISSRFPDEKRSHEQCRRRWETLTKIYKHIEEYCMETGQDHWQLDEDELSSMKLDTAYRQDWYSIVKEVCSQRKRKEKGDCDLTTVKRSKGSDTSSSPFAERPEPTPGMDSLYEKAPVSITEPVIMTALDADHEQSTSINEKISTRPSFEVEKLSAEDEIRRLTREKDALIFELAQLRKHRQATEQDQMLGPTYQVLQDYPAEVRACVKEALQDEVKVESFSKAEQDGIDCELLVPRSRSLSPKFSSHGQRLGAMNSAGFNGFDPLEPSTFLISTPFIPEMDFWEFDFSPATWNDGLRK